MRDYESGDFRLLQQAQKSSDTSIVEACGRLVREQEARLTGELAERACEQEALQLPARHFADGEVDESAHTQLFRKLCSTIARPAEIEEVARADWELTELRGLGYPRDGAPRATMRRGGRDRHPGNGEPIPLCSNDAEKGP